MLEASVFMEGLSKGRAGLTIYVRPQVLQKLVAQHQEYRAKVTADVVERFTSPRKMDNLFAGLKLVGES